MQGINGQVAGGEAVQQQTGHEPLLLPSQSHTAYRCLDGKRKKAVLWSGAKLLRMSHTACFDTCSISQQVAYGAYTCVAYLERTSVHDISSLAAQVVASTAKPIRQAISILSLGLCCSRALASMLAFHCLLASIVGPS